MQNGGRLPGLSPPFRQKENNMENLEFRIAKLSLNPGDILVVKINKIISVEMAQVVKKTVLEATGHRKIMVIDGDTDLAVLTSSEIEARAAA